MAGKKETKCFTVVSSLVPILSHVITGYFKHLYFCALFQETEMCSLACMSKCYLVSS